MNRWIFNIHDSMTWLLLTPILLLIGAFSGCSSNAIQHSSLKASDTFNSQTKLSKPQLSPDEAFARGEQAVTDKKWQDAIEFYEQAAQQGHVKAQATLGWLFLTGNEYLQQDLSKSSHWFLQAAKQGDAKSQDEIGDAYLYGRSVEKNSAKAVEWYQKAANQGDAKAQQLLGQAYYSGDGIKQDYALSFGWYMKAAKQGEAYGEYYVGRMYHHGQGIVKNISDAIRWLESSRNNSLWSRIILTDSPSNFARIELASIYASGDEVPKDERKAFELTKEASDHGSLKAKVQLSGKYWAGAGVERDLPTAIQLLSEVISKDDKDKSATAKQLMTIVTSVALQEGEDALKQKSFEKAYKLFMAAAKQENAEAQYFVGKMYSEGQGVQLNWGQAISWWRKAADQEEVRAWEALGEALWYGLGVTKNDNAAIKLLLLARVQGNETATEFIQTNVYPGWHFVAASSKNAYFINTARISNDDDSRWFWTKQVSLPASAQAQYYTGNYLQNYQAANCPGRMSVIKTTTEFDANGSVVNIDNYPITAESWIPVLPDSVGEAMLDYVCSGFAKEKQPQTKELGNRTEDEAISLGSGWPAPGGFVVTNHHVVAGHKKIMLLLRSGGKVPGNVVMDDATNDLVLIRVKDASKLPPALPLATQPANAGARVFTIGYPHPDLMGSEPKITDGIISSLTGIGNDPRTYQISVPLQSGNSGGPLLNMNGEVVGITTAKISAAKVFEWTGDLPQNVNYAVKTAYLSVLLSSVSSKHKIPVLPVHAGSIEELAARIEKSVLIVIAE